MLKALIARPAEESVIGLVYLEYLKVFTESAKHLGLPLLPSLGRHSGASIDAALSRRSLLEIQRMGQWRCARSVRRYEKASQVSARLVGLPQSVLHFLQLADAALPHLLTSTTRPSSELVRAYRALPGQ